MNDIVKVPVSQLKTNSYNPNQQSLDNFELLCKSIQEDGFTLPVVVNSGITDESLRDMIIDGEHRWRAALVLAMPEVPIIYKDMSEGEMRASTLRHNKARGHHDHLLEAQIIKELVGEIGVEELSAHLNMDSVELDIMLEKANDFTSMEDVALVTEGEILDQLATQGLTGENAKIVAKRHGMIGADAVLENENRVQLSNEAGQNIRVELIYSGEEAEYMRGVVLKHESAHNAILYFVTLDKAIVE